ncbi:unnamed protein product, partial [Dovyalis caffra]
LLRGYDAANPFPSDDNVHNKLKLKFRRYSSFKFVEKNKKLIAAGVRSTTSNPIYNGLMVQ